MVTAQVRSVVNLFGERRDKVFLSKEAATFTSLTWDEAIATHKALGDLLAKRALGQKYAYGTTTFPAERS